MVFRKLVEDFISHGNSFRSFKGLLHKCVEDGSTDSMICVRRLFESDYGGITFNTELKYPAAWTLASWKKAGLGELYENRMFERRVWRFCKLTGR